MMTTITTTKRHAGHYHVTKGPQLYAIRRYDDGAWGVYELDDADDYSGDCVWVDQTLKACQGYIASLPTKPFMSDRKKREQKFLDRLFKQQTTLWGEYWILNRVAKRIRHAIVVQPFALQIVQDETRRVAGELDRVRAVINYRLLHQQRTS